MSDRASTPPGHKSRTASPSIAAAWPTSCQIAIRAPAALALDREHAIARDIDRRHARMAATLIQGALFDRRTEREATSQRELIDEAMSRCHTRIAELHRLRPVTTAVRPAFSLIAW